MLGTLVSQQRGGHANPDIDDICWLSLLLVLLSVPSGSDLLKAQTFKIPIRSRTVEDGCTNNHSHYINSTSKSLFILLPIYHKKLGNGLQKSNLSSETENAWIEETQWGSVLLLSIFITKIKNTAYTTLRIIRCCNSFYLTIIL